MPIPSRDTNAYACMHIGGDGEECTYRCDPTNNNRQGSELRKGVGGENFSRPRVGAEGGFVVPEACFNVPIFPPILS